MAQVPPHQRVLLIRSLRKLRSHGHLTSGDVRYAARTLQVDERTVWRWLQGDSSGQPGRPRYRLTNADRDALADWRGSAAAAWRAQQAAGAAVPPLRTFQQAIRRELSPAERAALTVGAEGRRRHTVHLRWEADHKQLPVLVLVPKARRGRKPWVTIFVDAYSRLVMGWAISLQPSSATVLAALRMGVVVDPDRGPWGGVPQVLRWDNGLEFAASALGKVAATLGCLVRPTPPYTPHRKGKVERLHRTICQEFICGMPFYTDGPRAVDGRLYGPDAEPITLARFVDDFHRWVRDYNCSRSHQALGGQTPLTRWCANPTPIEEVPAEELRGLLLADVERTIAKDGIHFHNLTFIAPELNGWVGERVTVHYMPHDDRQIEVKIAGRWFTAKPQGRLSAAEQDRILARRREDADELARRQRRASRRARLRLAPITGPGPIEETTVVSRQQAASEHTSRTDRDLRRLARADLLDLAAGWTEPDERGPQKLGTRKATATSLRAPGARARRPQRRTTTPVPRSDRTGPPARRRREEEAET